MGASYTGWLREAQRTDPQCLTLGTGLTAPPLLPASLLCLTSSLPNQPLGSKSLSQALLLEEPSLRHLPLVALALCPWANPSISQSLSGVRRLTWGGGQLHLDNLPDQGRFRGRINYYIFYSCASERFNLSQITTVGNFPT